MTEPDDVQPSDLDDRLEELGRIVTQLQRDAVGLQRDVSHLQDFERDVVRDLVALQPAHEVVNHVRSVPNERALRLTDGQGRAVMGFVNEAGGDEAASYAEFEGMFRGSRDEIRMRQEPYLEMVRHLHGDILDLGCGRGEFLELVAAESLVGSGVDLDAGMVAEALALGLDVRVADLFEELATRPAGSVGAVFSAQVIEHLVPTDMERFIAGTHRVLADDGLVIIETVNPHSLRALRFFWLDRTHTIPVYPESALLMARSAGFAAAAVYFPGGTGQLAEDLRDCGDFTLICAKRPSRLVEVGLLEA